MDLSHDGDQRSAAAHELARWILTEGRLEAAGEDPVREPGSPTRFINSLCRRLVSAGVPLWRVTVYAATRARPILSADSVDHRLHGDVRPGRLDRRTAGRPPS